MNARLRRLRQDDERGFALVFVLFVTTVVMMAVTTLLSATTPNITGAKQTQDVAGALAAAQAGIDDAVAYLTSVSQCRSQTQICPQAKGADSRKLTGQYARPALGTRQSFYWTTAATTTPDGYVRVTATGSADGVNRRLVADLSLAPSILSYGYYTDYESQSPKFLADYYGARNVYISNTATYSKISDGSGGTPNYQNGNSAPQKVTWNAPTNTGNCGQHWYYESSSVRGRGATSSSSSWNQTGSLNGTSPAASLTCDLVFTTGMTEDGKTYSRDAFDVSYADGSAGPIFKQPVYTLWGYNDGRENFSSPSYGGQPWRGQAVTASPPNTYAPAVAPYDLTLPSTIGTDGLADNSCVYFGPTRVVLNGDGTATITSPQTTSANRASDANCYPATLTGGIRNFRLNYSDIGNGTIYVKNLIPAQGSVPTAGWPDNGTKLTQTPSAGNEVFWLPVTGAVSPDPSSSASPATCTASVGYSAAPGAACAWTNLPNGTNASSGSNLGWTAYGTSTACNNSTLKTSPSDRELFECEYSQNATSSAASGDQYSKFRGLVQGYLAGGSCVGGSIADQKSCITSGLDTSVLNQANTGTHAYNYPSSAAGDRQYYAVANDGASTSTSKAIGSAPANPTAGDALFGYTGTAGQENSTQTPITVTVCRQVKGGSTTPARGACGTGANGWGAGVPQFTFTITHTDSTVTQQPSGASYFPKPADVTDYNSGAASAGSTTPSGSNGALQPGDLYVEGQNNGRVSLVAQNDIVVTGDVTDYGTTGSDSQAVDLVAGNDVRNYHPVSCVDTNATDITNTSPGWCPNDISNLYSSTLKNSDGSYSAQAPQMQYANLTATGDHTIDAAIFTLSGSFRTDNFDRAQAVGNVIVNGGIYQSHRGGNATTSTTGSNTVRTGLYLNYHYVDLERANLPYAPPASNSANPRPWNVVSISAGSCNTTPTCSQGAS